MANTKILSAPYKAQGAFPVDNRYLVADTTEITNIENPYVGLQFYVQDLGKLYIVTALTSTSQPQIAAWKEVGATPPPQFRYGYIQYDVDENPYTTMIINGEFTQFQGIVIPCKHIVEESIVEESTVESEEIITAADIDHYVDNCGLKVEDITGIVLPKENTNIDENTFVGSKLAGKTLDVFLPFAETSIEAGSISGVTATLYDSEDWGEQGYFRSPK